MEPDGGIGIPLHGPEFVRGDGSGLGLVGGEAGSGCWHYVTVEKVFDCFVVNAVFIVVNEQGAFMGWQIHHRFCFRGWSTSQ